jgi:hypothetical protein
MNIKHERYVLLNIANEAGNHEVTEDQFRTEYQNAISRIRAAGINTPLVIDAAGWGRRESEILNQGNAILEHDPLKNIIFSWHPWDANAPQERIKKAIDGARERGLAFIIGEFSRESVCSTSPYIPCALIPVRATLQPGTDCRARKLRLGAIHTFIGITVVFAKCRTRFAINGDDSVKPDLVVRVNRKEFSVFLLHNISYPAPGTFQFIVSPKIMHNRIHVFVFFLVENHVKMRFYGHIIVFHGSSF